MLSDNGEGRPIMIYGLVFAYFVKYAVPDPEAQNYVFGEIVKMKTVVLFFTLMVSRKMKKSLLNLNKVLSRQKMITIGWLLKHKQPKKSISGICQ